MAVQEKERYIVTIGDKEYDLQIYREGEIYFVEYNGSRFQVEANNVGNGGFLFKIDGSSIEVGIRKNGGGLNLFLDGKELNATVEPFSLAELRKKAGAAYGADKSRLIVAPMPGLVLKTEVAAGDKVSKGQTLVIIEAMKMENMIKSPSDGVVKEVFVSAGQAVDKNAKLVELE